MKNQENAVRNRIPVIIGGVLGLFILGLVVATWLISRPSGDERLTGAPLDGMEILPLETGLTFARRLQNDQVKLLIVRSVAADGVMAIDVGYALQRPLEDPLVALALNGYDELDYVARAGTAQLVPWNELTVPLDTGTAHVAAGTNFRDHAEEVVVEDGPFLFPKLSAPTAWNAPVPDRGRLDYEAELCAVPLTRISTERQATFGFVLCNDYTDRWPLVRDVDFDRPMGTTGFPDAKGGDGMLPLGPLLVVPRDSADFHTRITLELFVNGQLRQRSSAGLMIWSPEEIATRALANCEQPYESVSGEIMVTPCDGIAAGTLLLTGTPAGVLFSPVTIWSPWAYLQSGDEVVLRAQWLGAVVNRIDD